MIDTTDAEWCLALYKDRKNSDPNKENNWKKEFKIHLEDLIGQVSILKRRQPEVVQPEDLRAAIAVVLRDTKSQWPSEDMRKAREVLEAAMHDGWGSSDG